MPPEGAWAVRWTAPPGVAAAMSTRHGGVSAAPFDTLNLGGAVGDDPAAVQANRERWAARLGATPIWLRQVHGTEVLRIGALTVPAQEADAAWTTEAGVACTVLVADCLPLLMCSSDGAAVAAVHAGWRGLAGGVVERTVQALCDGSGCAAADLHVWLGPCIGPRQFEVGADVLEAFGADAECFVPSGVRDARERWLADLPELARLRLRRLGVRHLSGGAWCTVEDRANFFSYRRDGRTGRMAASVWRVAV